MRRCTDKAKQNLWDLCSSFIRDYHVTCKESIMQMDSIDEMLPCMLEEICEIVGYDDERTK